MAEISFFVGTITRQKTLFNLLSQFGKPLVLPPLFDFHLWKLLLCACMALKLQSVTLGHQMSIIASPMRVSQKHQVRDIYETTKNFLNDSLFRGSNQKVVIKAVWWESRLVIWADGTDTKPWTALFFTTSSNKDRKIAAWPNLFFTLSKLWGGKIWSTQTTHETSNTQSWSTPNPQGLAHLINT